MTTSTSTGAYSNLEKAAKSKAGKQGLHGVHRLDTVIEDMIKERKGTDRYREIFVSREFSWMFLDHLDVHELTLIASLTEHH